MAKLTNGPMVSAAIVVATTLGSLGASSRLAHAEPFDEVAATATPLRDVASLVWSLTASCNDGDDVAKRQCRLVRDNLSSQVRGKVLLVDVAGDQAFEVGAWDAAKKSTPLTLRGCISCDGIDVEGQHWSVFGAMPHPPPAAHKGKASTTDHHGPQIIHSTSRIFRDEAAALAFRTQVVPRLRTQLLVKVPVGEVVTTVGDTHSITVEVVGFRVFDECEGSLIASNPLSGPGPIDKKACAQTILNPTATNGSGTHKEDPGLTLAQMQKALKPAVTESQRCLGAFGVTGSAIMRITIGGDGAILALDQTGDFAGTPTGECINTAIAKVRFPKSKRAKTTVNYPIVLR